MICPLSGVCCHCFSSLFACIPPILYIVHCILYILHYIVYVSCICLCLSLTPYLSLYLISAVVVIVVIVITSLHFTSLHFITSSSLLFSPSLWFLSIFLLPSAGFSVLLLLSLLRSIHLYDSSTSYVSPTSFSLSSPHRPPSLPSLPPNR